MTKTIKMLLATALIVFGAFASTGVARAADVTNSSGDNVQSGSNGGTTRQSGTSKSGDAVGGQVVGVVSSGRTSVDARNTSDNVDVTSGDARGNNTASSFTGLNDSPTTTVGGGVSTGDINGVGSADNLQDGNNRSTSSQTSDATTGDGVGGQVIGVVTSAGGSASVVAANTTRDSSIQTGDSSSDNSGAAFVGLNDDPTAGSPQDLGASDVTNSCLTTPCDNVQDGDNTINGNQSAHAATGDGVGGQVIGVVSAGATSVDASNTTTDSDVTTGDSRANNASGEFAGLNDAPTLTVAPSDINGVKGGNVQDGSNRRTMSQTADATSGDAVAGQVSGVVTSAGGSASVVVANNSSNIDATSGDSRFDNSDAGLSGLNTGAGPVFIGLPTSSGGITG